MIDQKAGDKDFCPFTSLRTPPILAKNDLCLAGMLFLIDIPLAPKVTLFISDFPSDIQTGSPLGPFTITSTTEKVDTRARGRLLSLKVENDAAGQTWRYGSFRMDAQPDGRR